MGFRGPGDRATVLTLNEHKPISLDGFEGQDLSGSHKGLSGLDRRTVPKPSQTQVESSPTDSPRSPHLFTLGLNCFAVHGDYSAHYFPICLLLNSNMSQMVVVNDSIGHSSQYGKRTQDRLQAVKGIGRRQEPRKGKRSV